MEAGKFIARFLEINVLALITFCLNTVDLQKIILSLHTRTIMYCIKFFLNLYSTVSTSLSLVGPPPHYPPPC